MRGEWRLNTLKKGTLVACVNDHHQGVRQWLGLRKRDGLHAARICARGCDQAYLGYGRRKNGEYYPYVLCSNLDHYERTLASANPAGKQKENQAEVFEMISRGSISDSRVVRNIVEELKVDTLGRVMAFSALAVRGGMI